MTHCKHNVSLWLGLLLHQSEARVGKPEPLSAPDPQSHLDVRTLSTSAECGRNNYLPTSIYLLLLCCWVIDWAYH